MSVSTPVPRFKFSKNVFSESEKQLRQKEYEISEKVKKSLRVLLQTTIGQGQGQAGQEQGTDFSSSLPCVGQKRKQQQEQQQEVLYLNKLSIDAKFAKFTPNPMLDFWYEHYMQKYKEPLQTNWGVYSERDCDRLLAAYQMYCKTLIQAPNRVMVSTSQIVRQVMTGNGKIRTLRMDAVRRLAIRMYDCVLVCDAYVEQLKEEMRKAELSGKKNKLARLRRIHAAVFTLGDMYDMIEEEDLLTLEQEAELQKQVQEQGQEQGNNSRLEFRDLEFDVSFLQEGLGRGLGWMEEWNGELGEEEQWFVTLVTNDKLKQGVEYVPFCLPRFITRFSEAVKELNKKNKAKEQDNVQNRVEEQEQGQDNAEDNTKVEEKEQEEHVSPQLDWRKELENMAMRLETKRQEKEREQAKRVGTEVKRVSRKREREQDIYVMEEQDDDEDEEDEVRLDYIGCIVPSWF